jgi:hypothetical protein
MRKGNVATIQNATAKALAAQVERTLGVARIKGWAFPPGCDVAVSIIAATPLVTRIKARMDDISTEGDITPEAAAADIAKISDTLVAQWLATHATAKPKRSS